MQTTLISLMTISIYFIVALYIPLDKVPGDTQFLSIVA